jgi:hypothetical protein
MSDPTIKVRRVKVTPAMAEKLLEANTHNRAVRSGRVEQYAADMRRGDWQFNGEAIKVAASGRILDGQHRLMAILEADTPVTMMLITGLPDEVQETMDQGLTRSFGDILKLRGESDYYNLAAATRIVCVYERDGLPFVTGFKQPPTVAQTSRTLDRNAGIRDSVKFSTQHRRPWMVTSAVGALHYLFSIVSADDATDFFHRLATGENLTAGSPIYVLRERLIKEHSNSEARTITAKIKMAFIIRAWNAYQDGETLTRLQWSAGGSNPDRFPRIHGLATGAQDDDEAQAA